MSRVPQAKSQAIMTVNRLNSLHSDQENSSHSRLAVPAMGQDSSIVMKCRMGSASNSVCSFVT